MGNDEPCLEWVPCMPGTTVQEYPVLSQNVPLGTELTICPKVLVYARTGIECHRSPHGYNQGIIAHLVGRQGSRGASTPLGSAWWPPGRIQQELVIQHMYGRHKYRSYIDTHQFSPFRCKLFKYNRVSNNKVHKVFTKVQYPWLSYYGGQQEYNIRSNVRSLPISGVQVYRSLGVQEFRSTKCLVII